MWCASLIARDSWSLREYNANKAETGTLLVVLAIPTLVRPLRAISMQSRLWAIEVAEMHAARILVGE